SSGFPSWNRWGIRSCSTFVPQARARISPAFLLILPTAHRADPRFFGPLQFLRRRRGGGGRRWRLQDPVGQRVWLEESARLRRCDLQWLRIRGLECRTAFVL